MFSLLTTRLHLQTGFVTMSVACLLTGCGGGSSTASESNLVGLPQFEVTSLSSATDKISGGSTMLQIKAPSGVALEDVKVMLNGTDVTAKLTTRNAAVRTMSGLVDGLTTNSNAASGSANTIVVTSADGRAKATTTTLTNFPITGPILSGPQLTPYECRTVNNGLGAALDANCSASTIVKYFYRASDKTFKPLPDPTLARPSDLVTTTTIDGQQVPYIVRLEVGTINRGVYRLAMLDDPAIGKPLPAKFVPGTGWNKRLVFSFSFGAGANYNQGTQADAFVLSDTELSRGFAYMSSTELWNSQHSNPHLQGETLMMLKEHFIKTIGVPKWTVGTGGSGGSIQQHLIAQLYPGLLNGLQPSDAFPETLMAQMYECRLVNNVFKSDLARWTTAKQVAVQGYNAGTCNAWDVGLGDVFVKADSVARCGLTEPANVAKVWNKTTNPTGSVFCTIFDTNANLFGKTARGSARRPTDNVGVQYGLTGLLNASISTTEFLDFNQQVGGFDEDGASPAISAPVVAGAPNPRMVGDLEAIRLAYAGGFKNSFTNLQLVPIVNSRITAGDTGNIHDIMEDIILRARLIKANGNADNQVIFTGSADAAAAGFDRNAVSLDTITAWLDALAADPAPLSAEKIVRVKPASARDACWNRSGVRINETQSNEPGTACNTLYPRFSTLRLAAGEAMAQDGVKCKLKPINAAYYSPIAFTPAEMSRLAQIFPAGVCDWTQPGVNQVPLKGTYLKLPLSE
jgi:hypothetical protein